MAAPAPNPFQLGGAARSGPAKPPVARVWTEAEAADKLRAYIEVPPEHWELVRAGTHVRYYTQEGFRPGGFVAKNPSDSAPQGAGPEKRYIRLQSGFNDKAPNHFSWVVAYEDLTRLFVKPDATTLTVMASLEVAVKGLNENIRKLADFSKGLAARVAALEAAAK